MTDVTPIDLYKPPLTTGDEKALMSTHLKLVQQALIWKCEGLSDADLRRPMTKTGTNLIGIVKHLTGVTYGYLCSAFGRERETFPWEFDEELFYGLDNVGDAGRVDRRDPGRLPPGMRRRST